MATRTAPRRTQAERRASSRAKLLQATLDCLAERGYGGTTIPEVVARAGLSNGALWRHFRSKTELLVAAVEESEAALAVAAPAGSLEALEPPARVDAVVAYLWEYARSAAFQALIELLRASRVDPELAAGLQAGDADTAQLLFGAARRMLGPELAEHAQLERNVRLLCMALYGMAITDQLRSEAQARRLLGDLQAMARGLFGMPG